MDFQQDPDRSEGHVPLLLLGLLLVVPVGGGIGVLALAIAASWLGW